MAAVVYQYQSNHIALVFVLCMLGRPLEVSSQMEVNNPKESMYALRFQRKLFGAIVIS
jgi:hypothetical protein